MSLGSMVAPFALTRQASAALEAAVADLEADVVVSSYRPSIEVVADESIGGGGGYGGGRGGGGYGGRSQRDPIP